MRRTAVSCARHSRLTEGQKAVFRQLDQMLGRNPEGLEEKPRWQRGHESLGLGERLGGCSKRLQRA